MPYKDPQVARVKNIERKRRWRARLHAEKYGPGAGDQRGKHGNHPQGANNHRWSDGRIVGWNGYVKTRVGIGHGLADPNGYAYEHLIVWMSAGNKRPEVDEVIHHKNGDTTDNRISNLEIKKRADHSRMHVAEIERDGATGRFVGKKAAGRLLDGREHNEMPEVRP